MRAYRLKQITLAVGLLGLIATPLVEAEASSVDLGDAKDFAILGAETVTNTGPTLLEGNLGVSPGSAITGFPPGLVDGTVHQNDGVADQAQIDARAAYTTLENMGSDGNLSGQDLGGMTLTPGVYTFSSSAQLTGDLVLDGNGPFVFQIGSTLTTASGARVMQTPGYDCFCDVFWQVGSSATLGTTTRFAGTILADQSVTFNTGAILAGRAVALEAAVTMDSNHVNIDTAAAKAQDSSFIIPTPSAALAGLGLLGMLGLSRQRRHRRAA